MKLESRVNWFALRMEHHPSPIMAVSRSGWGAGLGLTEWHPLIHMLLVSASTGRLKKWTVRRGAQGRRRARGWPPCRSDVAHACTHAVVAGAHAGIEGSVPPPTAGRSAHQAPCLLCARTQTETPQSPPVAAARVSSWRRPCPARANRRSCNRNAFACSAAKLIAASGLSGAPPVSMRAWPWRSHSLAGSRGSSVPRNSELAVCEASERSPMRGDLRPGEAGLCAASSGRSASELDVRKSAGADCDDCKWRWTTEAVLASRDMDGVAGARSGGRLRGVRIRAWRRVGEENRGRDRRPMRVVLLASAYAPSPERIAGDMSIWWSDSMGGRARLLTAPVPPRSAAPFRRGDRRTFPAVVPGPTGGGLGVRELASRNSLCVSPRSRSAHATMWSRLTSKRS